MKAAIVLYVLSGIVLGLLFQKNEYIALFLSAIPLLIALIQLKESPKWLIFVIFLILFTVPIMRMNVVENGRFFLFPALILCQIFAVTVLFTCRFQFDKFSTFDVLILIYLVTSAISTKLSIMNATWGVKYLYVNIFGGYLFYICLKQYTQKKENLHIWIFELINSILTIVAGYCLIEYVMKYNFLYHGLASFVDVSKQYSAVYRAAGTLEHPLVAGLLFLMWFPINVARMFEERLQFKSLISSLLLSGGILVTGSRSSFYFLLLSGMLLVLFIFIKRLVSLRVIVVITTAFMLLIGLLTTDNQILTRVKATSSESLSSEGDLNRYYSVLWAIDTMKHYWLWGLGPLNADNFKQTDRYSKYTVTTNWGMENSWTALVLDHGVMGSIPFFLILIIVISRLIGAIIRSRDKTSSLTLIGFLVGFIAFLANLGTFNALNGSFTVQMMLWVLVFIGERYAAALSRFPVNIKLA
ncbi:O-antigen ligase family protein [Paenibacillus hexagrammi]|uniref:O-antigen ligase family protein n=1 Tax=Paenibacillus hexagrammi TaxID=2908839 RepID=A0ABY3SIJ5_9BACL|nr:O-antigen ligase family protein [Paenibacillus sp. YPD9-1]UJF32787.1 O-antigen ligase family protein [Paenibacillus sp. YPD9-1]